MTCCVRVRSGITHFDLANNYGPPAGSAEENFGRILQQDLRAYRDELIISTKAGYWMWNGPYGEFGSRKYLTASLDQSLRRMQLEYVDIFYSHRYDPETPLEETMGALDQAVRSGKALYAGISSYGPREHARGSGDPALARHAVRDSPTLLLDAESLGRGRPFATLAASGIGSIAFTPLAQGLLTGRYLDDDSPQPSHRPSFDPAWLNDENLDRLRALRETRRSRAEPALSWRSPGCCDAVPSRPPSSVSPAWSSCRRISPACSNLEFTDAELAEIDTYAVPADVNLWAESSDL